MRNDSGFCSRGIGMWQTSFRVLFPRRPAPCGILRLLRTAAALAIPLVLSTIATGCSVSIGDDDDGPEEPLDAGVQGCAAGLHDGGDGQCVAIGSCSAAFHDDGNGDCVAQGCGRDCEWRESEARCVQLPFIQIPSGAMELVLDQGGLHSGDVLNFDAFELGRTPVTVAQYRECVDAGACAVPRAASIGENCAYSHEDRGSHPMNCITWQDAVAYCQWIGGRLPTAPEWEYASTHDGAGHLNTGYPWGDENIDHSRANYDRSGTKPVGSFSPAGDSPLGLVDMIGNVWEWTSTPGTGSGTHLVKGGAWSSPIGLMLNVSNINEDSDDTAYHSDGVRCAR